MSGHAYEQMFLRGVRRGDITSALKTARSAIYTAERDTWRLEGGKDLDGDPLVVVVSLESWGDVVVTVFGDA
jgi:hypothetical protein